MNLNDLLSKITDKESIPLVKMAYEYAERIYYNKIINNISLITYYLRISDVLVDHGADAITIISCLLYKTLDFGVTINDLEDRFNKAIAEVAYITKMINDFESVNNDYGKLLSNDINHSRSLFIKSAERYITMKQMKTYDADVQTKIARNTIDVLIPNAHRLHLSLLANKMEDLCLYYLKPDAYNRIVERLGNESGILTVALNGMKDKVQLLLFENGIETQTKCRIKKPYSIYNKLRSGKEWDDIYDILAIRILTEKEEDCNRIAELIQRKYPLVPGRFKDYIKNPKSNMYQSIHMTIVGDDGRFYEIQIRTFAMNLVAENGTASHQLYKEQELKKIKQRISKG